ncbi:transcriptional protein SWT1 [Nymphalis io]|uniref:transcriptional protein SWT1 n=1 Tax=Inachis io TaxID=171585 RepID=UPI002168E439|nr:transcriptional protein SWT1 [Nymphalis io]
MNTHKNDDQKLPNGWVLCKSKSIPGRKYYFNKKTGKSSWSEPQDDDKSDKKTCKKEKLRKQEKRRKEELAKKGMKRKSDGHEENASKKRSKQDTTDAASNKANKSDTSLLCQQKRRGDSPKSTSTPKTTPSKSRMETPVKHSPVKNLANSRLSQLRAFLNSEAKEDEDSDGHSKKVKISPKTSSNETPSKTCKADRKSPNLNDSKSAHSPSSDSLQSMPSPSQFFAANKIISSMKAQLPEEYCCKEKQKDTFADIEKGICSQTPEYPFSKHPATPPQFSEASKLVSAIKSKLAYKVSTSKDNVKSFSSAKERMEMLRANLSLEAEQETNSSFLCNSIETEPKPTEAMEIEESKEVKQIIPTNQRDSIGGGDNLVLVVDTNIFIHELDFIKNVLNSHIKGYSEQPTLLVPWRVINELDRLKDNNNGNGALCKRAKSAMDYLYKSLPENSRIKGQSLRDANSHIYPCEVPDDEILNCSLQQIERGMNVILVSNDKNLCNKASINGVKRINVNELKELVENKPQPNNDPDLLESVKHYQQTIYHLLANILENEMRAKYDNLWQHVLFKAPPWTLSDVLQCLLKHWFAVFNEVFPRIEQLITELKNSLASIERKDPNTLTQSEVANFKELCLDVAKRCQIIPEYMELAKATVERLLRNCASETENIDKDSVVDAFEGLWTILSSYSAKLASSLGIPHSIEDMLPGNDPLPVLTSKWTFISGHVNDLTQAIKGVLDAGGPALGESALRLHGALRPAPAAPAAHHVAAFCLDCGNMLQEAYNKFSQLSDILNVCKSRFSNDMN